MGFADQGACVIEGPTRWTRDAGPGHGGSQRGKSGVVLDLKRPEGVRAARALIDSADVLSRTSVPASWNASAWAPAR